ncbi:MAG: metal ABC transporter solute-binding protein, Zn/Mn family [Patescibacteria group bacterium]
MWLSIDNTKKQIDNITEKISEIDKNNAKFYIENSTTYKNKLTLLYQSSTTKFK